jgi:hypothetical protein
MKGILRPEAERRSGDRNRVLLTGKIVYGSREEFSFPCAIKNRSETGARLTLPAGGVAPDEFQLLDMRTGEVHEAKVTWRRHPQIGVALTRAANVADADRNHLRALWMVRAA